MCAALTQTAVAFVSKIHHHEKEAIPKTVRDDAQRLLAAAAGIDPASAIRFRMVAAWTVVASAVCARNPVGVIGRPP